MCENSHAANEEVGFLLPGTGGNLTSRQLVCMPMNGYGIFTAYSVLQSYLSCGIRNPVTFF